MGNEGIPSDADCMKTTRIPVIRKRPANERGRTEIAWLHSRHSFSFGEYFDPDHMGFRSLRVINDDVVEPGMGFGSHPHRDVEILTYVVEGALQHKDSIGNGEVIRAGDVQYMRAGRGVVHSEFNASHREPVHFLQIWIKPREAGGEPRYAQRSASDAHGLILLASGDPAKDAIHIEQDAELYFGRLSAGEAAALKVEAGRGAWLQVIQGNVAVNGETLTVGDGLAIEDVDALSLEAASDAEFLLFVLG